MALTESVFAGISVLAPPVLSTIYREGFRRIIFPSGLGVGSLREPPTQRRASRMVPEVSKLSSLVTGVKSMSWEAVARRPRPDKLLSHRSQQNSSLCRPRLVRSLCSATWHPGVLPRSAPYREPPRCERRNRGGPDVRALFGQSGPKRTRAAGDARIVRAPMQERVVRNKLLDSTAAGTPRASGHDSAREGRISKRGNKYNFSAIDIQPYNVI